MKKIIFIIVISMFFKTLEAQTYIHTSGRYILGPCNDTLVLKGINYAPYNWGWDINSLNAAQIAQTGANIVRMVWYTSSNNGTYYTNYVALDSAISKCVQNKMMVILELHDFTCTNNASNLINGANWFINPSVLAVLVKYKESIIVNINEALYVDWDANPSAALTTYQNTYQTIISNLRAASGFNFPILIDAPDCGTNIDKFIANNTASNLISSDPLHNIIFSGHAYWYSYANNDSLTMATKINNVLNQNIPLILGEVANLQDDATPCQYTLNYTALLKFLKIKNVGWLAWSWDNDQCTSRQISTNGNYNSLSTYGNDIVNNSIYGLQTNTTKSQFLQNGYCLAPLSLNQNYVTIDCKNSQVKYHCDMPNKIIIQQSEDGNNWELEKEINIVKTDDEFSFHTNKNKYYKIILKDAKNSEKTSEIAKCFTQNYVCTISPNPANDFLNIQTNLSNLKVMIKNLMGETVFQQQFNSNANIKIETSNFKNGIYFIELYNNNLFVENKKIVIYR